MEVDAQPEIGPGVDECECLDPTLTCPLFVIFVSGRRKCNAKKISDTLVHRRGIGQLWPMPAAAVSN
jgi:hypothetical protein